MSWVKELVTENPMLIEIRRFGRRLMGSGTNAGVATAAIVLVGIAYAGLLLVVALNAGALDPLSIVFLQGVLFVILAPITLYASIAGEREKRTWDLLLVAPITKGQIVAGKFLSALGALAVGTVLFLIPIGICLIAYREAHVANVLMAELVVLSFTLLVCATTIFFSARARRPFVALGLTIGVLFLGLLVYPAMVAPLVATTRDSSDFYLYLHPFTPLSKLAMTDVRYLPEYESEMPDASYAIPHVLIYFVLSIILLIWTERTLTFAEGEAGFVPRKSSA